VFGGNLLNLNKVHHGVSSQITIIQEDVLFDGLPKNIQVGRYHSWVMNTENIPEVLEVTSVDENNEIMSVKHKYFDIRGVQFHPESILTPQGKTILKNWISVPV
jgi:anthranilate synthase component 2